ncbi:MAG: hypothetical protein CFH18_00720 [Alphaproteobacteria bacterium MarineAlpha5_Bin8]|nr:MAG: hypothetical protein CFH17_00331 [Alphaproteobacteria bacterium MarineAlpha5_Bin7]PPR46121.1 MAG: hypothetical protein CFH18_00720 [Alphaproteobacteria bacterium MarineAlpha5_Bin8]PPR53265.1 MAG: hypothetical protein CFH16_01106 [Alphaproteobacteria bacterium MarineAlpha5_Bin6]|tara:strand:- start:2960 stop:3403 length:444 start_codon:yes stop_codon:yes gene_type:complete
MDNKLKSKTRLAAIQLIAQHLINNQDIDLIKDDFDKNYRNTVLDENSIKIQYNVNFLSKLINYFKTIDFSGLSKEINNIIKFNRTFEKWDTINQAIILTSLGELRNCDKTKINIILNDYIEISKSFVTLKETKLINSILDKLIHENK